MDGLSGRTPQRSLPKRSYRETLPLRAHFPRAQTRYHVNAGLPFAARRCNCQIFAASTKSPRVRKSPSMPCCHSRRAAQGIVTLYELVIREAQLASRLKVFELFAKMPVSGESSGAWEGTWRHSIVRRRSSKRGPRLDSHSRRVFLLRHSAALSNH